MKFLFDVCAASLRPQDSLSAQGHDILSALERSPRATDEEILALAMHTQLGVDCGWGRNNTVRIRRVLNRRFEGRTSSRSLVPKADPHDQYATQQAAE